MAMAVALAKAPPTATNFDDEAHAEVAEDPLVGAKKLFRSVQRRRASQARSKVPYLNNQLRWMKELQTEAEDMVQGVSLARGVVYRRQDKKHLREIRKYIADVDHYNEEIAQAREKIQDLKTEIHETDRKLQQTHQTIGRRKKACSTFKVPAPERLYGRFEKAVNSFGNQLVENRRCVDEVRHLIMMKALTDKVHHELERDIKTLSKKILHDAHVTTELFDHIELTKQNTVNLKAKHERAKARYVNGMAHIQLERENFEHMADFVMAKNKVRKDEFAKKRVELKRRPHPSHLDNLAFMKVMQDLKARFGSQQLEEIAENFTQLVVENYSMFRAAGHIQEKSKRLEDKIAQTQQRILEVRSQYRRAAQNEKGLRQELKEKYDYHHDRVQKTQKRIDEADLTIDKYIRSTVQVLKNMGYSDEKLRDMAWITGIIGPDNIMKFLGEVEKNVNKLASDKYFTEFVEFKRKSVKTILDVPEKESNRVPLNYRRTPPVVPPAPVTFQVEDDVLMDQRKISSLSRVRPLSREQMTKIVEIDLDSRQPVLMEKNFSIADELEEEQVPDFIPRPIDTDVY